MAWRIGEILVHKKILTWHQLGDALEEQKRTKKLIGEILIEKKLVPAVLFYQALAEQYGMRFVDLSRTKINPEAVKRIPEDLARTHELIPIEICTGSLIVGISNPLAPWPKSELMKHSGMSSVEVVISMPDQINAAIEEHYGAKVS